MAKIEELSKKEVDNLITSLKTDVNTEIKEVINVDEYMNAYINKKIDERFTPENAAKIKASLSEENKYTYIQMLETADNGFKDDIYIEKVNKQIESKKTEEENKKALISLVQKYKESLENMNKIYDNYIEKVKDALKDIEKAKEEKKELVDEKTKLEEKLKETEEKIAELEKELKEVDKLIEELEEKLVDEKDDEKQDEILKEINDATKKRAGIKREVKDLNKEKESVSKEIEEKDKEIGKKDEIIKEEKNLKRNLKEKTRMREDHQKEFDEIKEDLTKKGAVIEDEKKDAEKTDDEKEPKEEPKEEPKKEPKEEPKASPSPVYTSTLPIMSPEEKAKAFLNISKENRKKISFKEKFDLLNEFKNSKGILSKQTKKDIKTIISMDGKEIAKTLPDGTRLDYDKAAKDEFTKVILKAYGEAPDLEDGKNIHGKKFGKREIEDMFENSFDMKSNGNKSVATNIYDGLKSYASISDFKELVTKYYNDELDLNEKEMQVFENYFMNSLKAGALTAKAEELSESSIKLFMKKAFNGNKKDIDDLIQTIYDSEVKLKQKEKEKEEKSKLKSDLDEKVKKPDEINMDEYKVAYKNAKDVKKENKTKKASNSPEK